MHHVFETAGRMLGIAYAAYMAIIGLAGVFGIHAIALSALVWLNWRGRLRNTLFLDIIYGFINPLIYLFVFEPYGVFRQRRPFDVWLDAVAWTLFVALWGARLFVPRQLERSATTRAHLSRLCALGLATIAGFALNDLFRVWMPSSRDAIVRDAFIWQGVWSLFALGPLYVIPAILLNRYRVALRGEAVVPGLLLLTRRSALGLVASLGVLAVVSVAASRFRPADATVRERLGQLAPVISDVALRYHIDPRLLAAIVYVTEREQHEPFRDVLERLAMSTFLIDAESHMHLARPFDFSIGLAQIKPTTALTALKVCKELGQSWELWYKHLRDVPPLGVEWQLAATAVDVCQPPMVPVPINKSEVVSALMRDGENVAFAGLILALYQEQWRSARAEWDISSRPDVLATLYQIGFHKSKPHGAPQSNAFGRRVAEVSREGWLQKRFDAPRLARVGTP